MYTFILQNASKLIYGSLIAIALYACWNVYNNYQNMKQTISTQSDTIAQQSLKLEILAKTANDNAEAYKKAKQDEAALLLQLQSLNVKITDIKEKHKQELSSIEKEIDNAPEEIKQCLRTNLPESIVSSLRKSTEASN